MVLRRVILPQMGPSLVSAAVLAFVTSFDEVVVALFLAGSRMTLPKKMFDNIRLQPGDRASSSRSSPSPSCAAVEKAAMRRACAAAPARSGWPARKATCSSGGAACTAANIAACSAATVAKGRAAAARSATQGASSNTAPSAATTSAGLPAFKASSVIT